MPIKRFYKLLLFCTISLNLPAQTPPDFSTVYPAKFEDAARFFRENSWIQDSLAAAGVHADIAVSVVFPEVLRFSAIRNWVETKSLEVLYSQYGEHYADFSVGYFQMKPGFALQAEKDWNILFTKAQHQRFGIPVFDTAGNPRSRYQRVTRLNDIQWEVRYLIIFMLVMEKRTAGMAWKTPADKLRYYATAYNTGYWKNHEEIMRISKQKDFYISMIRPSECYQYADVALSYYLREKRRK